MRVSCDLAALFRATQELHLSLGECARQTMHANPEWRSGLAAVEQLMLRMQREESEP
jgi:hypothetical protein